ncbi:class II fructose-bisphosphate aldolase, partial [Klebsiella pneumoniae]|nr:class II fructose-bisphosphate aldolase [Klebsiella pneumoniae]
TGSQELEEARALMAAQLEAGYTSFAVDASFNPLPDNIRITVDLCRAVMERGYGLEVELGEVTPVGTESNLTTASETAEFLS